MAERLLSHPTRVRATALSVSGGVNDLLAHLIGSKLVSHVRELATGETIGTTYPLTGAGISRAMETGATAGQVIDEALRCGDFRRPADSPTSRSQRCGPATGVNRWPTDGCPGPGLTTSWCVAPGEARSCAIRSAESPTRPPIPAGRFHCGACCGLFGRSLGPGS